MWLVLTPPDTEVRVLATPGVTKPILVTDAQLLAAGEVAAVLEARGLPCDLSTVLAMMFAAGDRYGRVDPAQQVLPLEPPAVEAAAATYDCVCGRCYDSELKLAAHQRSCGMHHQGYLIPSEHRI